MKVLESLKQPLQSAIAGYRFIQLVRAPYGDFSGIERLASAVNDPTKLQRVKEFLIRSPQARKALQDRPRLGSVDLQHLHQLPQNTLGYLYADHMIRNGFSLPPTLDAPDENAFISAHLFETHDIWHVVTGCPASKAGEIKLQAFYAAQIYPSSLFLALLAKNLLKTALEDLELCDDHLEAIAQGWTLGKHAKPLFGIEWSEFWHIPLVELREKLNLKDVAEPISSISP